MGRGVVALALTACSCTALQPLSDCRDDADCPLGDRCQPEGQFCELDRGPIQIGVVRAETGSAEVAPILEFIAAYLSDNGGVLGRDIEFVPMADRPEAVLEDSVAELIDRRVHAIIGGPSRSILDLQALTYPEKILTITPQATTPLLRDAQPPIERYVFRTVAPVDRGEAAAMARFVVEGPAACDGLAIVYSEASAFFTGYRDALHALVPRVGGCVSHEVLLPDTPQPTYPDLVTTVGGWAPEGPGCVFVLEDPATALRTIVTELGQARQEQGWTSYQLLGGSSFNATDFVEITSDFTEGAFYSESYLDQSRAATLEFIELMEQYMGGEQSIDDVLQAGGLFDVTTLIAHATTHVGGTGDRVGLRDALWQVVAVGPEHSAYGPAAYRQAVLTLAAGEEIHYVGATGDLELDEFGEPSLDGQILTIDGGEKVPVETYTAEQASELAELPDPGTCPPTVTFDLR